MRKESAVKQTSYLNLQTLITYTPVIILAPWCVWCTFNILSTRLFQVLSHLTYFRHIVTLDSYFPTMSQSTGTLGLAESNICKCWAVLWDFGRWDGGKLWKVGDEGGGTLLSTGQWPKAHIKMSKTMVFRQQYLSIRVACTIPWPESCWTPLASSQIPTSAV